MSRASHVKRYKLGDPQEKRDTLAFWLSKSPEQRLAAQEQLRRFYYGDLPRLERSAAAVQRVRR